MKRLGITVCTRQRPKMLEQCIRSICADINAALSDVVCFIVIVENDEFPRSKSIIDNVFHDHNKIEYHYECEPSLGIPIARNRAIGICLKNEADWLAFIDDDETLQCGWVDAMFQAATTLDADALTGPVHSILPSDPPVWLAPPSRDNRQHGELLVTAATNNTLIDCCWLAGNAGHVGCRSCLLVPGPKFHWITPASCRSSGRSPNPALAEPPALAHSRCWPQTPPA